MGPYIKDVRSRGGRGVNQKRTLADMGEGRGQRQNADVRIYGHISTKTQIFHLIWHNFDHLLDDWKVY